MLRFGLVSEFSNGKAKVKFGDDNIVTDWLPIIYSTTLSDKSFHALAINEQVACLMDDYSSEVGVILGAIYSDADATSEAAGDNVWGKEFADGTLIKYDQANHKLTINLSGSGAKVEVTGDLEVSGKIKATSDISTSGGDVKAQLYTLKTHKHIGVQTGGGTTGTPTP